MYSHTQGQTLQLGCKANFIKIQIPMLLLSRLTQNVYCTLSLIANGTLTD